MAIASDTATQNRSCASASFDNSDPSVTAFVTAGRIDIRGSGFGSASPAIRSGTGEPKALTTSEGLVAKRRNGIYRPGYRLTGAESELAHMQWSRASVGRVTSV